MVLAVDFAQFQPYLPIAVGFGVAIALLMLLLQSRSRGLPAPPPKPTGTLSDTNDETYANRRSASRRDGQPVRVLVSSPSFRGEMEQGWVLDRSTGGLRIAVSRPLPPGAIIQVRADNAPDTVPWTSVIVRSCRDEGKHHEIGCEFETTPPWNVLLLFG